MDSKTAGLPKIKKFWQSGFLYEKKEDFV